MELSEKQRAYIREAQRRWNFKGGATRSGKTWLDIHYVVPRRIRERAGLPGLIVLLGMTRQTVARNLLVPMRELYGAELVGPLREDGTVRLFGEECWVIGAEKVTGIGRLRGASVKYAYGDEVADWAPEVFELLKSRLDRPYACFDGTYNPREPGHWLQRFLTSGADVYSQSYGLADNPFLPEAFVRSLREEYRGSVFYDRYILGQWSGAEGALFPTAPGYTEDTQRLRGGLAHVDAAYGGSDCTALTLGKRDAAGIVLYGRLWQGHVDAVIPQILAECRRFSCAPLYCERNADRGYLARALSAQGMAVRSYQERENKFMKISTHLRGVWGQVRFLAGTDDAYLAQVTAYSEAAAHDDAPDSAACMCRLLEGERGYRSAFDRGRLV